MFLPPDALRHESLYRFVKPYLSVFDLGFQAPTVTMAPGSARRMASACQLMNLENKRAPNNQLHYKWLTMEQREVVVMYVCTCMGGWVLERMYVCMYVCTYARM